MQYSNGGQFDMSPEEEASEMQAKMVGKYGNEGRPKNEEEQEYLQKKAY